MTSCYVNCNGDNKIDRTWLIALAVIPIALIVGCYCYCKKKKKKAGANPVPTTEDPVKPAFPVAQAAPAPV